MTASDLINLSGLIDDAGCLGDLTGTVLAGHHPRTQ